MTEAKERYAKPGRAQRVRAWHVWTLPWHVLAVVLLVDAVAVALIAVAGVTGPSIQAMDLGRAAILCAAGLCHVEVVLGIERARHRVVGASHIDLGSVWMFAAVIALPPVLVVLVAVVVNSAGWLRHDRTRAQPHRHAFSTATMVLGCLAAWTVAAGTTGGSISNDPADVLDIVLALLTFTIVNTGLIAVVIAVSTRTKDPARLFGHLDDNVLEIATLSLGAMTGVALLTNPWWALAVLPIVLVLHRAVLLRQMEVSASTDGKTGLLNAAAWQIRAADVLRRRRRGAGRCALLLVDLDHFKGVNDRFGHLVGDRVLLAVAQTLQAEARGQDCVGRFGGEEFAVLLSGLGADGPAAVTAAGERIRQRIADLRVSIPDAGAGAVVSDVTASVGGAVSPGHVCDLHELLQVADTALYAAKRAGRNVVRIGPPLRAGGSAPG